MSRLVTYAWLHGQNPCFHRAGRIVMGYYAHLLSRLTSHRYGEFLKPMRIHI